jgi:hypothetical protein
MDENFVRFWAQYPRKEAKGQAYKTWLKLKAEGILPEIEVILKAIENRTKAKAWPEKTFIKHPSTWLNAWGWEDEIDTIAEHAWHETSTGIEEKGRELGIKLSDFESFPHFKIAVMRAAMKAA